MKLNARRILFLVLLVVLLGLHVYHAFFQLDFGWWGLYGGLAFWKFFTLSLEDPILSAGLSDFTMMLIVFGIWMYTDMPAAERLRPKTFLWLVSYLVFPGVGALLYFLWLRPNHRVLTGPDGTG